MLITLNCLFCILLISFLYYFFLFIKPCKRKGVEIWCLTFYLFRRLGELTLIVLCDFGHSFVNLGYKIAFSSLFYRAYQGVLATIIWSL